MNLLGRFIRIRIIIRSLIFEKTLIKLSNKERKMKKNLTIQISGEIDKIIREHEIIDLSVTTGDNLPCRPV